MGPTAPRVDGGPIPPDAWLDEAPWEFNDVGGSITRGSRRFFIERINIAVFYDTDKTHGPPMSLPPRTVAALAAPPLPGGAAAEHAAQAIEPVTAAAAHVGERELLADATPVIVSPKSPATRSFPQALGAAAPAPVAVAAPQANASPPQEGTAPVARGSATAFGRA
ncbi:MAG TPA: hypothetical protein VMD53_00495 [Rhizomicrobium sp.]|nr:hypothetical protein [Rhizomicrobium sp.]